MGAAGSVLRVAREEKEQLHEKTLNREVGILQQDHFDMLYMSFMTIIGRIGTT